MSTITTRSGKGSPLTNSEVDANFTNLNTDKLENINSESIKDLSDVYSSMSPSDGQALVFDSTNGWQAETIGVDTSSLLALSGGTMTGNLEIEKNNPVIILDDSTSSSDADTTAYISFQQTGTEKGWVGWGSNSDTKFTVRNALGAIHLHPSGANNAYIVNNQIFHDGYHPNADKWTTSRTLSLTGGVTGSVSWDGSANASLASTVALATSAAVGGIKIGYTENGKNYPVELSNGQAYVNVPWTDTDTNTNQLTTFAVVDGDTTQVIMEHGSNWKFVEGGGIDINWTDTDGGYTSTDPFDLTFTINTGVTAGSGLTGGGILNANRTISHADTSNQASVNNSNGTVIQDVTLDGFGHVTGLGSVDLDSRYVNVTGDTMTGKLNISYASSIGLEIENTTNAGWAGIEFSDNSGGSQRTYFQSSHADSNSPNSAYGAVFKFSTTESSLAVVNTGEYFAGSTNRVFHDGYHPNADKWTTARTLTLTGDVTGSVSWDGSGNVSMTTAVGDADTVDGYDASRFMRRIAKANATVGGGWMTVASNTSSRKHGEVVVTDGDSGDHAFIRIDWMRSFADSNFTVINCGGHANRITGVRVLYETADNTYGTKLLQVYVTTSSNYEVNIYEHGDINDYGTHSVVTPVIENTKTGYAVHGNQLETLDTYGFAVEEGLRVGGNGLVNGDLQASGLYVGSANTSYDFYNNGTSYLNGATTIDANTQINGVATISTTNDYQLSLSSSNSWTGIHFNDSGSTNEVIWYNGGNGTFAIGGGGSNVSGKKLHIDGGTTIGVNYDATSTHTNGLKVEGHIETAGEYYAPNKIIHTGDTDTYMQFHAANSWRVVTGGTERLEATNSGIRIDDAFTLPTTDGSANQVLTTDGNGTVSWTTQIDTNTNTNQLTTFQLEDGDGTEVTISHGKEVKFVEGGGIDINWTDTSTGSDGDPYDLTFTADSNKYGLARLLGWEHTYGSSNYNDVYYDEAEDAVALFSSSDTSIGMAYRAVAVTAGQKVKFTIAIKSSAADTDGLYLRLYYYTGDLPDGKTHVSNSSSGGSSFVQEDTNGDNGWNENGAHTTSWRTFERTWTAPTTGYVSLVLLNWSGFSGTLYAKQPDIETQSTATADKWTTARTLSLTGEASGSVSWDGSANASLSVTLSNTALDDQYVDVTGDTMTGRLYIDSTSNDKLILRGSDDPSIELQNSSDAFRGRLGVSNSNKEIRVVGQDPDDTNAIHILGIGQNGLRYSTNNGGAWYKVWHANNDGSGSGLNADTVDGVHESSFMRKSANSHLNMNNYTLQNVNDITFNDPGPNEGLTWNGGNGWKIYESPNDLSTNSGGNLQFVTSSTRRMTLDTSGDLEVTGGANFGSGTLTANGQNDVFLFGTSPTSGTAQSGAFHNKLRILGGDSQTRDLQLWQEPSGYAHIGSSYSSNALYIDSSFQWTTFENPIYINDTLDEKITLRGSSNPYIRFEEGSTDRAYIQWSSGQDALLFRNQQGDNFDFMPDASTGAINIRLRGSDNDTWGSVYADDNSDTGRIGFLDDDQNWAYRITSDSSHEWIINTGVEMSLNATALDVKGNDITEVNNIYLKTVVYHDDDTNTYFGFPAADQFQIFRGGTQRLLIDTDIEFFGNVITDSNSYMKAGYFWADSDINLKDNLVKVDSALDKVSKINGYTYNFKETPDKRVAGLIAQEVEKVLPEAVNDTKEGTKALDYNATIAVLVEAIKEQQLQIEELQKKLG